MKRKPDYTDLDLSISILLQTEWRQTPQPVILADCDFDGWSFYFKAIQPLMLIYKDGVLRREDGVEYRIGSLSIGELIEWDILQPYAGNYSTLPIYECPECQQESYMAYDYICCFCRKRLDHLEVLHSQD